jgi:hypothetical protein
MSVSSSIRRQTGEARRYFRPAVSGLDFYQIRDGGNTP